MRKFTFLLLLFSGFSAFAQLDGVPIDSLNPQKNLNFDTSCTGFSAFRVVALKNTGNVAITIDSIQVPPPFFFDYLISSTINPGDTTTLGIRFSTLVPGSYADSLSVFSSGNNPNPYRFALLGVSFPTPNADFDITSDTVQCLKNNRFTFSNKSTIAGGGDIAYEWLFGDGYSDTAKNPDYSYNFPDTFSVLLVATAARGCATIEEKTAFVLPSPRMDFDINRDTQCFVNHLFEFTSQVQIASGSFNHAWNFGDGNTSTQQNPTHTYSTDSSYNVRLISISNLGCADTITRQIVVVPSPTASFSANSLDQCLDGNQFIFSQGSTVKSGNLSYFWTFGDNTNSTLANPTKTYTAPGRFSVRMRASTPFGCADSLTRDVNVLNMPNMAFTVNDTTQCFAGNLFDFNNTSSVAGGNLTHFWNFGNGDTSSVASPKYNYDTIGTFIATLESTTNNGCIGRLSRTITVHPEPEPSFSVNEQSQCLVGNNFIFTNTTSGMYSFTWRFGDNESFNGLDTNKVYNRADSFEVLLVATSADLCTDSIAIWVYVNPNPAADFGRNFTGQCANQNNFLFTNRSSVPAGTFTNSWNFGDGNTSTDESPSHIYSPIEGLYDVKLVTISDSGCTDSMIKSVRVWPSPIADFSVNDTSQCLRGNSFQFTNLSTVSSGTLQYTWNFGNTNSANTTNASQSYNIDGVFQVSLIARADSGCLDTALALVYVNEDPTVDFRINQASQCLPANNFIFTNTSTISAGNLSAQWNYGDGSPISNAFNGVHSYAGADTFFVTLRVTTDEGCTGTEIKPVFVNPVPLASISVDRPQQCRLGNNFTFTSRTQLPGWNFSDNWTFGDGAVGTGQSTAHAYISPGDFTVKLVSTTSVGCADSATIVVVVHPQPVAGFGTNSDRQCYNRHFFQFNNTSTIASGVINNFWYLGDGTTSTMLNPSKVYPFPDTFMVSLVTTSDFGCKDSIARRMFVYPDPIADFIIDDTSQCISGNIFNFLNQSSVPGGGGMVFNWRFGDGIGSVTENPVHTYRIADTFSVRLIVITGGGICSDTAFRTAIVTPLPDATFSGIRPQECHNSAPIEMTPIMPGGFFYGDNVVGNFFNPVQLGRNTIFYVAELNGCVDTSNFTTIIISAPNIDLGPDTMLCIGEEIGFNVTSSFATYLWSNGNTGPRQIITSPGIYTVRVSNQCGTVNDQIEVKFYDFACDAFVPNAFSPDGNTVNDVFKPFLSVNVDAIDFRVFNRWGNIVFQTFDPNLGWDGTFQGKPAQPDVYGWSLSYTVTLNGVRNIRTLTGNVTLIR